jgi:peptidylprolyl isomerase
MQGNGDALEVGDIAVVHFTCRYRGLSAVSSREARTLGGNRTIAEPLEFKYGRLPGELNKPLMRKSVVGIGAEVKYPRLKIITFYSSLFT